LRSWVSSLGKGRFLAFPGAHKNFSSFLEHSPGGGPVDLRPDRLSPYELPSVSRFFNELPPRAALPDDGSLRLYIVGLSPETLFVLSTFKQRRGFFPFREAPSQSPGMLVLFFLEGRPFAVIPCVLLLELPSAILPPLSPRRRRGPLSGQSFVFRKLSSALLLFLSNPPEEPRAPRAASRGEGTSTFFVQPVPRIAAFPPFLEALLIPGSFI